LKADYDVEVEWRAFELHPEIPPEGMRLPPNARAGTSSMFGHMQQMAREAGLRMVTPEVIPNSRRALEAAEYARDQGRHEEFHRILFHKFYGEGRDLGSWTVLRAAAQEAGLDPATMQKKTEAGEYGAVVDAQIARARTLGVTGVPAYSFDDRSTIVGAQPYEAFRQVMDRLGAKARRRRDE